MNTEKIAQILKKRFLDKVKEVEVSDFKPAFEVDSKSILEVCKFVKDSPDLSFDLLSCMAGVDRMDGFEVVYVLFSFKHKHKLTLKAPLPKENPEIESVSHIWAGANWHEREIFELFGIKFKNHPDPRPLLLPEGWDEGYPMRKGWKGADFIPLPER